MFRKIGVLAAFVSTSAGATELREPYEMPRELGMGDAGTAVANDDSAIWYNPAGIARSRKAWSRNALNMTRFPNALVAFNPAAKDFYSAFSSSDDKSSAIAATPDLGSNPFWARSAAFPVAIFDVGQRPSFPLSIGAYSNTIGHAQVDADDPTQAQADVLSDIGGVMGGAYTNKTNRVNLGFQARSIYRVAYEDMVPTSDLLNRGVMKDRMQHDSNKVSAFALDAGAMFTVADFWFPTLGLAVFNLPLGCRKDYLNPYSKERESVCGTVFTGSFSNPDALTTVDPMDLRIGLAMTPRLTRELNMRFSIDAHHLALTDGTNQYGYSGLDISKMIHGGVEVFFGNPLLPDPHLAFRAGVNQGFLTSGATVRFGAVVAEAALYGKDISATSSPKEDRRYIASLGLEF